MPASDRRTASLGRRLKHWLYVTHRWLGIGSCILFAMWFLSGLVMIYVPFPALTRGERLAGLPVINWNLVRASLRPNLRAAGLHSQPRVLLLEMRGDVPVWEASDAEGELHIFSALNGEPLPPPTESQAQRTAERFADASVLRMTRIERDQWTVAGGFDRHRPLWKVDVAGPGGRTLYVSGPTGAVVLDTNARERFWNWLGSVPHWLYPTVLRQDNAAWRQVVMWVSGPCIVTGITGFWIGILRTRLGRRRYRNGRMQPYLGWMAWHHWAGLIGGFTLIAWMFSGWLSVDPFRLFASGGIAPEAQAAYEQVGEPPAFIDVEGLSHIAIGAKQMELRWIGGAPLIELRWPDRRLVLDPATIRLFRPQPALPRLVPGATIRTIDRLTRPDAYYYAIGELPQLPVLRVKYTDRAATWAYVDPDSGRLLDVIDTRRRLYRWLFDLLHKWDFNLLTLHRPAWDLLLWLLSALGVVTSISGIWIGWKRLRRRPRAAT